MNSDVELLPIHGVDRQVLTAATEMDVEQKAQPEWLWYDKEAGAATYGRWAAMDSQAPYIRADLVLPFLATPNRTGGLGAEPAASDVASEDAKRMFAQFLEADDRTSPEEYPDMILVTEQELRIGMTMAIISDRVRRELAASPAIPADHVVVPREPTGPMYGAGGVEMFKCDLAEMDPRTSVGRIYRAMLAAAPSAPASPPVGDGWRDIATAPNDEWIIVWGKFDEEWIQAIVKKLDEPNGRGGQFGEFVWATPDNPSAGLWAERVPRYWRPLPAPPSTEGDGK